MSKKFFDIIPPDKDKNFDKKIKVDLSKKRKETDLPLNELAEEKNFQKEKKPASSFSHRHKKIRSVFGVIGRIFLFSLFFLFLIWILDFLVFSKVKIEIWPKITVSNFETKVVVKLQNDKTNSSAQSESVLMKKNDVIPGKIFEYQKSSLKEFSSSGKIIKENKAEGIIRVFNNYSTYPQSLLPNTRFVSDKGKLFRSFKREVIPGGSYIKGKFTAGFTDIKVRAAESGKGYNIGPSTFSIPGFKGTSKYTYFYAKSFVPMTGGFKGEVSQVTENDIKKAKLALGDELKKESRDSLKKTVPMDYVLLDKAIFQNVIKSESLVKAGSEAESFNLQMKMDSRGVGFKKLDMDRFVQQFILSHIAKNKAFLKDSVNVNYSFNPVPSWQDNDFLKSGEIILTLNIKTKVYEKINMPQIKKALSGKSLREARAFLENLPNIIKIKIGSCFLRKTIPDNINRIELILHF